MNRAETEIRDLAEKLAPALIAIPGCAALTAAKTLGETADITRFRSAAAYARHNGTAPLPVWSSNRARHRLSRTGNRQLNAALHRIAMPQTRCHQPAKDLITRRRNSGDGGLEALRILKRRLSDVVYRAYAPTVCPRLDRGAIYSPPPSRRRRPRRGSTAGRRRWPGIRGRRPARPPA
ncbi:IS110 family transposase [Polymorphospora sp. NPDC050346]|uniref:IS110 family transposase n=1 Tax=Polymorphospora sp. NPDC050346 TaxID=3155780 RepID=UPI0033E8BB75